jgi:hypothetical protein
MIVIPTLVVMFFIVFLHSNPDGSLLDLLQLLILIGGGAVAGWLFRKKHGPADVRTYVIERTGAYRLFLMHSVAIAIFSSLIFATASITLNPKLIHGIADSTAIKVLAVAVPLALLGAWVKVYLAMLFGQWLFRRAHPAGL